MNNVESIFAAKLLEVKAIKLQPSNPFTWASGWKSPFYCDNRKTLSFPDLRSFVKVELTRLVMEQFPEAEGVAGVATLLTSAASQRTTEWRTSSKANSSRG